MRNTICGEGVPGRLRLEAAIRSTSFTETVKSRVQRSGTKQVRDNEVNAKVPIAILVSSTGRADFTQADLCSLWVRADHAYIATRLVLLTNYPGLSIGMFLGAHTAELHLKAAIVGAFGSLPKNLQAGAKGHDLCALARHLLSSGHLADFFDEDRLETLRRLAPMTMAGRYPNAEYRFGGGSTTEFLWWLDRLVRVTRETFPRSDKCRDEIQQLRGGVSLMEHERHLLASAAAREALFFQNKEFDGWWESERGPVFRNGQPWRSSIP